MDRFKEFVIKAINDYKEGRGLPIRFTFFADIPHDIFFAITVESLCNLKSHNGYIEDVLKSTFTIFNVFDFQNKSINFNEFNFYVKNIALQDTYYPIIFPYQSLFPFELDLSEDVSFIICSAAQSANIPAPEVILNTLYYVCRAFVPNKEEYMRQILSMKQEIDGMEQAINLSKSDEDIKKVKRQYQKTISKLLKIREQYAPPNNDYQGGA